MTFYNLVCFTEEGQKRQVIHFKKRLHRTVAYMSIGPMMVREILVELFALNNKPIKETSGNMSAHT